uniref:Tyrosinase copper-binding domain-containing protein n=1 Tax=Aegilops tauschii TaxID=37682 RepID=M8C7B3_AEGTA
MESTRVLPSANHRMPCSLQTFPRRNVLRALHRRKDARQPRRISISCEATGGGAVRQGAIAAPIQAPDLRNCQTPDLPNTPPDTNCCPPPGTGITDFELPPASSPLRVRPAAHLVDAEYLAKYERAVALMKQLPADDPRSFEQQWHVHCAYCDAAFDQVGFPDLEIQVHNCWLFFPWHRFYVYFHERILGKLIGDDTFALPFWNWDAPAGMTLPAIYANRSSPLYDERRDPAHQPPVLIDLDSSGTDANIPRDQQIDQNLKIMTIRVTVTRPRVSRSRREKEEEEEVLVVEGIEIADHFNKFVKFDVLVNEPEGGVGSTPATATGYCAGSFAHTPHMVRPEEMRKGPVKTVARFGVCDLMDDIGADDDQTVVVSLVPRCGGELVTVGGVSISYLK